MSQPNVKFAEFRQKISEQYQKNPALTVGLGALLVIIIVGIIAIAAINAFKPQYTTENTSFMPEILPTPTLQYTLQPTPTVISTPSNQWVVNRFLDNVTENGFTYAVAEFRNLSDGSLVIAQCQQPKVKQPEIGHLYVLQITEYGDWYFTPIEGYGTFQMFRVDD